MRRWISRWAGALAVILTLTGSAVCMARSPASGEEFRDCAYVLGEYGGCVAVFCPGEGLMPRQVTGLRVSLLPRRDREQLRRGIGLESRRELFILLEDYSS